MTKKTLLLIFFIAISITQTALVIHTAGQSNMFAVDMTEPWFKTLLIDFYFNTIILSAWVIYKEKGIAARVLWIAGFWLTGATATALYVAVQIWKLRPGESFASVLLPARAGQHERRATCDAS